jgi:hypothetical protein
MIYRGDKPLVWSTDEDTQAHTGVSECFFVFPSCEIANRVMAEVPSLFDLDEDDAEALSVREMNIPG